MRVIIVCTGNTCRSPMAEAVFKRKFGDRAEFVSRGTSVRMSLPASANAVGVMKEIGLDISNHFSKSFDITEAKDADIIIAMTQAQKKIILSLCPEISDRVFTLCEYAGCVGDIDDPFGGDMDAYRACAKQIIQMTDRIQL